MKDNSYSVQWAPIALKDLEKIIDYLHEPNPKAAKKAFSRIKKRAQTLRTLTTQGRRVPELAEFEFQAYRELLIPPYRLIYRIEEKRVYVLGVFDSRRDLNDLLLWRLVEL